MDKNQVYRFVVLTRPHPPLKGLWGGLIAIRAGACVKMERVDRRSRGKDRFSPSVVVVLTASCPGGADKETGMKETSRGVDCISRPGIRAEAFSGIWCEMKTRQESCNFRTSSFVRRESNAGGVVCCSAPPPARTSQISHLIWVSKQV